MYFFPGFIFSGLAELIDTLKRLTFLPERSDKGTFLVKKMQKPFKCQAFKGFLHSDHSKTKLAQILNGHFVSGSGIVTEQPFENPTNVSGFLMVLLAYNVQYSTYNDIKNLA
jgi:hypothetical protein